MKWILIAFLLLMFVLAGCAGDDTAKQDVPEKQPAAWNWEDSNGIEYQITDGWETRRTTRIDGEQGLRQYNYEDCTVLITKVLWQEEATIKEIADEVVESRVSSLSIEEQGQEDYQLAGMEAVRNSYTASGESADGELIKRKGEMVTAKEGSFVICVELMCEAEDYDRLEPFFKTILDSTRLSEETKEEDVKQAYGNISFEPGQWEEKLERNGAEILFRSEGHELKVCKAPADGSRDKMLSAAVKRLYAEKGIYVAEVGMDPDEVEELDIAGEDGRMMELRILRRDEANDKIVPGQDKRLAADFIAGDEYYIFCSIPIVQTEAENRAVLEEILQSVEITEN